MSKEKWQFTDLPSVMVITTRDIIQGKASILSVYHDQDDGMWQFLDGEDVDEARGVVVSLEEIVELDSTIRQLADLPLGSVAWRKSKELPWYRQALNK